MELIIRSNIKYYDDEFLERLAKARGGRWARILNDIEGFEQEQRFCIDGDGFISKREHYSRDAFSHQYCDLGSTNLYLREAAVNNDYKGIVDTLVASPGTIVVQDALIFDQFLNWAYGHKRGD